VSNFKLKVLVADDSSTVISFFEDMAGTSPIPFDVVRAHDGRQCMELLNRGGMNLAFIDVNMPEMSGMEAVYGARHIGVETFITLMSGTVNAPREKLARQLKVYEFLAKPFLEQDVLAILRTYNRITVPTSALVVDDSATVRRIVSKVLTNSIFTIDVTEAGDGQTALTCCEDGEFDVIFLDCNMPGLDGLETLERLIERDPDVKVIMITGDRNEDRRRWALDRGAKAFLFKPFRPADIDRELHALFGLKMPELAIEEPQPMFTKAAAAG